MTQKERSKRIRRNCFTKRAIPFVALMLLVLAAAGGGYYTYAKYFSQSARWGIAVASKVYFTANYAAEDDYDSTDVNDSKVFFESVVSSGYNGTDVAFPFEVRNYENNLLFNESSVVIPYTMKFWTEETPVGATYSVVMGETTLEIGFGENHATVISDQSIGGGSAYSNDYTILIDVTDNDVVHTAVPIYVEVMTDHDAVVHKTLRGKMVLNVGGAVAEMEIESCGFVVQGVETNELTLDMVNKMSVLTYEVTTIGEALGNGTEKLKISWNPDYLEIDIFDESYDAWLKSSGATEPGTETIDNITWNYITIDAMPYSAETVCFLRGHAYDSITKLDELNAYVNVGFVTN